MAIIASAAIWNPAVRCSSKRYKGVAIAGAFQHVGNAVRQEEDEEEPGAQRGRRGGTRSPERKTRRNQEHREEDDEEPGAQRGRRRGTRST